MTFLDKNVLSGLPRKVSTQGDHRRRRRPGHKASARYCSNRATHLRADRINGNHPRLRIVTIGKTSLAQDLLGELISQGRPSSEIVNPRHACWLDRTSRSGVARIARATCVGFKPDAGRLIGCIEADSRYGPCTTTRCAPTARAGALD